MQDAPPKKSFWSELKRRHVVRVALTYLVVGFVVIEAADILLPALNLPDWTITLVVALTLLGFPIALGLAWAFDVTPEGIVRDSRPAPPQEPAPAKAGDPVDAGEQRAASGAELGVGIGVEVEGMPSIAILPFVDMSPDRDQEYFGDGMAEELINALTRLKGLRVAARTSSFAHKGKDRHIREIGKDLEVGTILEGSVRKAGTRLRITAQLIQVDGGHHLWSEVYEREMEDVFAIQDEITKAVVEALRVELLGEPGVPLVRAATDNLEAYDLYLKGRHYWSRRYRYGLQTALQYFEEAVEKDPDFALPYAGIAEMHTVLGLYAFVPPREARERAAVALEKATALGPELPEVLCSQGLSGLILASTVDEAERTLARVLGLDLNHGVARGWHGLALIAQGRWERGLSEEKEVAEREPHSAYIQGIATVGFVWAHRATSGIPFGELALKLEPDGVLGLYALGYSYSAVGRHDEAVNLLGRAVEKTDRHHLFRAMFAQVLAAAGRVEEVVPILNELLAMHDPARPTGVAYSVGSVYGALGDGDNAVKWMDTAVEEGFPARLLILFGAFDAIRGHPGFARIIENAGLPAFWADPTLGGRI